MDRATPQWEAMIALLRASCAACGSVVSLFWFSVERSDLKKSSEQD